MTQELYDLSKHVLHEDQMKFTQRNQTYMLINMIAIDVNNNPAIRELIKQQKELQTVVNLHFEILNNK